MQMSSSTTVSKLLEIKYGRLQEKMHAKLNEQETSVPYAKKKTKKNAFIMVFVAPTPALRSHRIYS